MDMNINFPNLHIYLSNVIKSINIASFTVAMYGICIAAGVVAAVFLVRRLARISGQNPDIYIDLAIWGVIFGIIGARIYYVAFSWDLYKDNPISILNLRQGGLAIYGGVIAAVIVALVYCKIKKLKFFQIADTAACGLILGQIFGRWGNFFNREAFGGYTDNIFAMQLPVSAVRARDISDELAAHIEIINNVSYIQVHPTFLYECLWNIAVLIIMILTFKKTSFYGQTFFTYLLGYAIGRFWIESLRTDQLQIFGGKIAVSQMLAAIIIIVSIICIIVIEKKKWLAK